MEENPSSATAFNLGPIENREGGLTNFRPWMGSAQQHYKSSFWDSMPLGWVLFYHKPFSSKDARTHPNRQLTKTIAEQRKKGKKTFQVFILFFLLVFLQISIKNKNRTCSLPLQMLFYCITENLLLLYSVLFVNRSQSRLGLCATFLRIPFPTN